VFNPASLARGDAVPTTYPTATGPQQKPDAAPGPTTRTLSSDQAPAFELLEAKLLPPQGRGGTVRRDRLIG